MLLIHVPRLTNRIGYTLNVIFNHVLHTGFSITTDEQYYLAHGDAKFSYGPRRIGDTPHLKSCNLLTETTIEEQEPRPFQRDGQWMLFPVYGRDADLPFDPLAATFYMVSRYEEYLPHREDEHNRFPAGESLAAQQGFLHLPVVDQWAMMVKQLIKERYSDFEFAERHYRFVQTVDIDAAWSYLHKGVFRTVVGGLRDLFVRHDTEEVRRRIRVLAGREKDPFDTFDYIIEKSHGVPDYHLLFFCLLADYDQFNKPSSYLDPNTRQLIQHLGDHAKMGIHNGYYTLERPSDSDKEVKRLEEILHRNIVRARFHFLRMQLPRSYRVLQHTGIRHDYTMGFVDAIGFRAGISSPFPFYDLERDHETELLVHPFCVMDTTLQKYLKQTPE